MNILESLSRGLRSAGGVLNPAVERQLGQEQMNEEAARRQFGMQMLQQRIADEREQAIAQVVGPALQSGDYRGAAAAAMSVPGGARLAPKFLEQHAEAERARVKALADERKARYAGGFTIGNKRYDWEGNVIATGEEKPQGPQSAIGKLISDYQNLPPDSPYRPILERQIREAKAPGGGVTVNNNMPSNLPAEKTTRAAIDKDIIESGANIMALREIDRQFKPQYQETFTRAKTLWSSAKDKMGFELPQAEREQLADFSKFKRNAIDTLNKYIKSITGAAMSIQEAERILRGLPNPGTGLFDGDSPVEFKAKLDDAMRQMRFAQARYAYMKRSGLALGDAPQLDKMPTIMNSRAKEIETAIRSQKKVTNENDIRALTRQVLSQEFGLVE